ncbi:MAG: A/G-specific adenine glycosylase [Paludibacteraceae bacterium]|nr:A/G-specific adenine glycosylase [Paludibacteraceae bacterium]
MNRNMKLDSLYRWYEQNHRVLPWRDTTDPYCIWVSEIILQQTRVAQGMDYYLRFVSRFPDLRSLAEADEDDVLLCWQGLGYYSRARNLHRAARMLWQRDGKMPDTFEGLRQMPGVGDYTAGAIASFAYNLPYPALDGNGYRVLSRLFDSDAVFDTSAGKRFFHQLADSILDRNNPRLFNSAIMELGALQCVPGQPDCRICPLRSQCMAEAAGTVALLPVRKPRSELKDRFLSYTVYLSAGQTLIYQRQGKDIWQHLWEFPVRETDSHPPIDALADCPINKEYVHVLSHQRLHARFVVQPVASLEPVMHELAPALPSLRIVALSELSDYALSRLTQKAVEEWLACQKL